MRSWLRRPPLRRRPLVTNAIAAPLQEDEITALPQGNEQAPDRGRRLGDNLVTTCNENRACGPFITVPTARPAVRVRPLRLSKSWPRQERAPRRTTPVRRCAGGRQPPGDRLPGRDGLGKSPGLQLSASRRSARRQVEAPKPAQGIDPYPRLPKSDRAVDVKAPSWASAVGRHAPRDQASHQGGNGHASRRFQQSRR